MLTSPPRHIQAIDADTVTTAMLFGRPKAPAVVLLGGDGRQMPCPTAGDIPIALDELTGTAHRRRQLAVATL